jgi:FixJ family two-component response regulator
MIRAALAGPRAMTIGLRVNEDAVIHIIDDDASMRKAVESLLRSVGLATRPYASVNDFLAARRPDAPGCLVLDVRMPGVSGLDFQTQLSGLGIHLPVVFMTGYGDVPMSVRSMKAGAVDFLIKPFRDQDMLDAVTAALERDKARRIAAAENADLRARFATLSPREQQVMRLVSAGKMNKQVAGELGLSEITVKIHRGAAMRKMGARTLAELVRMSDALEPDAGRSQPG